MAYAKSKIGRILYKIFKDKAKAKTLYLDVTRLVLKQENDHLKSLQWFRDAQVDLKQISDEGNDAYIEFGILYK